VQITAFIGTLEAGGAERVLSILANQWVEEGHDVDLITFSEPSTDHYPLNPTVFRHALGTLEHPDHRIRRLIGNVTRVARFRRLLRQVRPDVVVSFIDKMNILTILATRGLDIPVVVSERTDPRRHNIGRLARILRRRLYPLATCVVVQTDGVAEWVATFVDRSRIAVIPNPVPTRYANEAEDAVVVPAPYIVALGRLVPIKGFDLLIQAFAEAAVDCKEWSLLIIGEGPQRGHLEALASELGVGGRVILPGLLEDPHQLLEGGSIFALTSAYEGFPNALLEAMAAGLAVVAFDCPSGPRAIIRDGIDGILLPPGDRDELAKTLHRLMHDKELRAHLATRAPEVQIRFSVARVMDQWQTVLAGGGAR
jgi:GalNAc-alpha-(1->4)-GalNAc-alpha-(1->3)-diNAcBac-PP-undecaprenol alpha-1,4-N-acetyl-D-galactosaminyltransferase